MIGLDPSICGYKARAKWSNKSHFSEETKFFTRKMIKKTHFMCPCKMIIKCGAKLFLI